MTEQPAAGDRSIPASDSGLFPLPGKRASDTALEQQICAIGQSAIVDGLLEAVQGLMAIINENRQIISVNQSLLKTMGVPHLQDALGLRIGEAFNCLHANEAPEGCGTGKFCASCGAAISQALALSENKAVERLCAIDAATGDHSSQLFFRIKAAPMMIAEQRFLFLFIQDVSHEQRVAALERTFLHDLKNTTVGISLGASMLANETMGDASEVAQNVLHLSKRLTREIELQRCISQSNIKHFKCSLEPLSIRDILKDLQRSYRHHPASTGRTLHVSVPLQDRIIRSDATILHRILHNMVINALEACEPCKGVAVSTRQTTSFEVFDVWNAGHIPADIALRIFQRNFSTKGSLGRGLGTYSMKLLGETLLGGQVSFTSSPEAGTCFSLALPVP